MKKLRVGIFGAGRGAQLGKSILLAGGDVVAICDFHKDRLAHGGKSFPSAKQYLSFDEFIEHPMDAVLLANYFHEHTPYAIRCLERGIHVLSECTSNGTMAEGVELVRAAERSSAIYMLAENYPFMKFNREITRVTRGGTLGKVLFGEGEYNHPIDPMNIDFKKDYNYFPEHWRNYLPKTYYITHSLAPLMMATGAVPRKVSAFACPAPFDEDVPSVSYSAGDRAAIIMTKNDDGSVFRVTGCAGFGAHGNSYRVCGTKGQIENLRGMGERVMLRYNSWEKPEDISEMSFYEPSWNDKDEDLIERTGHGGGDFLVVREFLDCIREKRHPELDVYFATTMASVAILAHRSVIEGGRFFDVPDFRREEDRKLYENDRKAPFPGTAEGDRVQCCEDASFAPTQKQRELFEKLVMEK